MINPQKAAKLIRQHFEELTTEQFVKNLRDLSHEVESERKTKDQQRQRQRESEVLSTEKF